MSRHPKPPMDLGEVLDYDDYRSAARVYISERAGAVERYEQQARTAAEKEADYQRTKAEAFVRLKASGITATEAEARVRGEDDVCAAQIERDTEAEVVRARKEDIAGIDEASAHLRKIAEWSQRYGDLGEQPSVRRAA